MNPSSPETTKCKTALPTLLDPFGRRLGFPSVDSALTHLLSHVLSEPESNAWAVVCPDFSEIVDLRNADRRFELVEAAMREAWQLSLLELLKRYVAAGESSVQAAVRQRWFGKNEGWVTCFSPLGILVGFHGGLRTIYIPGAGSPARVRWRQESVTVSVDSSGRLQRSPDVRRLVGARFESRGVSPGTRDQTRPSDRPQREKSEREAKWTREQMVYYRVFRPAFRAILRQVGEGRDDDGPDHLASLRALVDQLPRGSPTWERWQEMAK